MSPVRASYAVPVVTVGVMPVSSFTSAANRWALVDSSGMAPAATTILRDSPKVKPAGPAVQSDRDGMTVGALEAVRLRVGETRLHAVAVTRPPPPTSHPANRLRLGKRCGFGFGSASCMGVLPIGPPVATHHRLPFGSSSTVTSEP